MRVDELNVTNFVDTGLTTAFSRYTFTVHIKYHDNSDVAKVYGPVLHTFPNDLAAMPLSVRKRFALDMIHATIRVALGINQWSDYE